MSLQCYIVGGAVRDRLLGRPVKDRDWVVVGATPEALLAQGFRPVGRDFPVFLHPHSHEEYALARTERKTGKGYHGFVCHAAPDVTLEEDLARRDLTINAMAQTADGDIIDPYHGQDDLRAGVLRHVSLAFAEDPVRILRLARFAARYGFTVADDTRALMRQMVANGEADALVAERVWQELAKGLMETTPSAMFTVLRDCGALARIAPEIDALWGVPQRADYHPEIDCGIHTLLVLDYAAQENQPLPVRFAALTHDLGKALTPAEVLPRHLMHEQRGLAPLKALCERLRVPVECRELALLMCAEHTLVHRAAELRADTVLKLFKRTDALRRPARFAQLLAACRADARGRTGFADCAYPQAEYLASLLAAAQAVNAGEIARGCPQPGEIALAVDTARVAAIEAGKRAWQA